MIALPVLASSVVDCLLQKNSSLQDRSSNPPYARIFCKEIMRNFEFLKYYDEASHNLEEPTKNAVVMLSLSEREHSPIKLVL